MRIVRIIEAYPHLRFVLFGDDSQEDPNIYSALVDHFPHKIFAVYIRRVHKNKYTTVQKVVEKMTAAQVHCCYFIHSAEAIAHSKSIGLIIIITCLIISCSIVTGSTSLRWKYHKLYQQKAN